ncbi:hypothetical protein LH29_06475 [Draconibacterium sediminis]|uniref:Nuclear transport factor 2 family protein n=2 Tax=Draconibacterium sediminis TaxID=1544798 RepID=A0A0D8JGS5_9BACT|nr:hypothetical protein LH29_06475 [Draconibacterium sediminis]
MPVPYFCVVQLKQKTMRKIDPKKLSVQERVEKLNDMIVGGHILEAFEKFYADDVIRQKNDCEKIVGKNACRLQEENLVTGITAFRKAIVKKVIIGDKISVVEWEFDYIHEDIGEQKYSHITLQKWNCDGQIISETIYNNN